MERPLGVTLIAILTSLWAILSVAAAFEGYAAAVLILSSSGKRGEAAEMLLAGVIGSIVAVLFVKLSRGLLNLRKWARTVTILFTAINLILGFGGVIASAFNRSWTYSSIGFLSIGINLVALLYLLRGHVKEYFTTAMTS